MTALKSFISEIIMRIAYVEEYLPGAPGYP